MKLEIEFTGFAQRILLDGKPFIPAIYHGTDSPNSSFNTIHIALDASESSSLNWRDQIERARHDIKKGFLIFWELDFSESQTPLIDDEQRFLALQLSVAHFTDTIWPEFQSQTLGVALYRGTIPLEKKQKKLDELKGLAASLPDEVGCFLFLDASLVTDLWHYFQLVNQEGYGHLKPIVKGFYFEKYPFAVPALGWNNSCSILGYCSDQVEKSLPERRVRSAICLPTDNDPSWALGLQKLEDTPFRLISENLLDQEWDGIDHLIVLKKAISERGQRKICGFIAAGGLVDYI